MSSLTTTYAYAISRRTFKYKRFFTVFALITMLFNAGMIPGYIVVTQLLQSEIPLRIDYTNVAFSI